MVLNPTFRLIWADPPAGAASLTRSYEPMDKDLACDIHVVSLRTMQQSAFKQVVRLHQQKKLAN